MFLFQFHEDSLHQLEEELQRDERGRRHLRDLDESRIATASIAGRDPTRGASTGTARYTGPERRLVPCPEMKEAMIP
jgi:hypothetical protein